MAVRSVSNVYEPCSCLAGELEHCRETVVTCTCQIRNPLTKNSPFSFKRGERPTVTFADEKLWAKSQRILWRTEPGGYCSAL